MQAKEKLRSAFPAVYQLIILIICAICVQHLTDFEKKCLLQVLKSPNKNSSSSNETKEVLPKEFMKRHMYLL
jgi:cytidine deaminase